MTQSLSKVLTSKQMSLWGTLKIQIIISYKQMKLKKDSVVLVQENYRHICGLRKVKTYLKLEISHMYKSLSWPF